jgi:hypothetical protein
MYCYMYWLSTELVILYLKSLNTHVHVNYTAQGGRLYTSSAGAYLWNTILFYNLCKAAGA